MSAAQRILAGATILGFVAILAFPPMLVVGPDDMKIVDRHFGCAAALPQGASVDWPTLAAEIGALVLIAAAVAVAIHPYRIAGERN